MKQTSLISQVIVKQSNLIEKTRQILGAQQKLLETLTESHMLLRDAYDLHQKEMEIIRERLKVNEDGPAS
jgi:hypothetical protein